MLVFKNHYFYERPDGEALGARIYASMEIPITAALSLGIMDAFKPGRRVESLRTLQSVVQRFIPMGCMAFMFTVGVHAVAKIRQKDDAVNHGIGALAAMPVLRAYTTLQTTVCIGTLIVCGALIGKAIANDPVFGRGSHHMPPCKTDTISWYAWTGGKIPPTGLIKYD